MRVIHLNQSDIFGGAARAAYRIHQSLNAAGVDSRMWVDKRLTDDPSVESMCGSLAFRSIGLRRRIAKWLAGQLRTGNSIIHSPSYLSSQWVRHINKSDADIVNLHWVQGEMLSVVDIGKIKKPIVWTLHDMWAFCGAEHYTDDNRWREGYYRNNRPEHESGFDLNRWTWERKRSNWGYPMHIITPSQWLADCVRQSVLMANWPVSVVANPIDTNRWQPIEQDVARLLLGLPQHVPLVLFGAMSGRDPRKGFDLLLSALGHLRDESSVRDMQVVVFGQHPPEVLPDLGFPFHYTGLLKDDLSLRALYSASDSMIIPSRQDNLPNTGVEAHACGTPVVAFRTGGMSDIVNHQVTGYLAESFDPADLAQGIVWVLGKRKCGALREQARQHAIEKFESTTVGRQYESVYKRVI